MPAFPCSREHPVLSVNSVTSGASRVAIVHDWLTGMRGGEKVLEAICELYPDATLHTLVRVPGSVTPQIERHVVKSSAVQWLPKAGRFYRHYLPLFPTAVELIDLDGYDLVISSSHCAVKSVIRSGRATHVCYCHSPMRYAWDQFPAYFGPDQVGAFRSRLLRPVLAAMARWDAATAGRVDRFLANSQYVAGRIRRYYNRGSAIVYPPVDTVFYRPPAETGAGRGAIPSFLVVSALVPYKRVETAIEACRLAGARLTIVGRGPEEARLRQLAGPDVEFLGLAQRRGDPRPLRAVDGGPAAGPRGFRHGTGGSSGVWHTGRRPERRGRMRDGRRRRHRRAREGRVAGGFR